MGDEGNDGTSGEWGAGDDADQNEGQNVNDGPGGYDSKGLDDLLDSLGMGPNSHYTNDSNETNDYDPGGAMWGQDFAAPSYDLAGNVRGTFDPNMNVLGPDFDQQVTQAQNARGGRSGASPEAIAEYNSLGFNGGLRNSEWSYTDLDGKTNLNYGSIVSDLLGFPTNPLGSILGNERMSEMGLPASFINGLLSGAINIGGYLSGLGPALTALNAVNSGTKGNTAGLLSSLGGLAFGSPGALGGSILGNFATGRNNSAATSMINSGIGLTGNNSLGSVAAGAFTPGSWESYLAGMLGGQVQSTAISSLLGAAGVDNRGHGLGTVDQEATNQMNQLSGTGTGENNDTLAALLATLTPTATATTTTKSGFTPLYRGIQKGIM